MNACYLEVVDSPTMTPTLLYDTEASQAMASNMDREVSAENKSDTSAINREFPEVLFDERSNKENLTERVHSSIMQDIEIDESIRLSRENSEVLSDNESERMQLKAYSGCFCFLSNNGLYSDGQDSGKRHFS